MQAEVSFIGLVFPLLVFLTSGILLVCVVPAVNQRVRSLVDRLVFGLLAGMAFYMLGATVLNALLRIRLTTLSLVTLFLVTTGATGYMLWKRRVNPLGKVSRGQVFVLMALLLVLALAIRNRLDNTLKHPTRLLNNDSYRHHDRTRAIVATGVISPWDSNIYGKVPILEMQGCYILPAVISLLSGVPTWHLWKYGAPVVGALSVLGTYLLVKYSLRGNSAAGILAAAFLAASPVHILRTNIGFSEAYALPFLPVTLLCYLFLTEELRYGYSFFFGLFYTAMAMANPNPAYFLVPLLTLYGMVMFVKHKRRLRLVTCILISSAIFFALFGLWTATFSGMSPLACLKATSSVGTDSLGTTENFTNVVDLIRNNLGRKIPVVQVDGAKGLVRHLLYPIYEWLIPALALVGVGALIMDRRKETEGDAVKFNNGRVFHIMFLFLSLLIAILMTSPVSLPVVGRLRLPSFTIMLYRYYLLPGWGVSMLAAWALIACADRVSSWRVSKKGRKTQRQKIARRLYVVMIVVVIGLHTAQPWVWGHFGVNCTEEEYAAADWIKSHTPEDALIIAPWRSADFLKSLTGRRMVVIGELRDLLEIVDRVEGIERPRLSERKPVGIIGFASKHKEPVYLVSSKHGPSVDFAQHAGFTKLFDTQFSFSKFNESSATWSGVDTRVKIYRVEKDGETRWAKVGGNLSFLATAIGGCESGTIRNLSKLNDGSLGRNRKTDAVYTDPAWERSGTAWFGLDFKEKHRVVSLRVTFGMYAVASIAGKHPLQYVPLDLHFQYWKAGQWVDIGGSRLTGGSYATLRLNVGAIETEKVRVVVTRVRNEEGQTVGGIFRVAALEFAAYTHHDVP